MLKKKYHAKGLTKADRAAQASENLIKQRFDNHVDKLMNYIRYQQATGESIKTSIRTKTRLGQIVQEGRFREGTVPYGYRLEKQGRMNKKNHEVNEILVDEKAVVVKLIYEKYVNEGFGAQRFNRFLYKQGFRNRKGVNFTNTTIIKVRHPQDCDGQSGYSAEKLDGLVEKMVLHLFRNIKTIPEAKLMAGQAERKTAEAASTLTNLKAIHASKTKELESYKSEVYKVIQGTSNWSGELLNELIAETKSTIDKLDEEIAEAQTEVNDCKGMAESIRSEYSRILTWADMYEGSSIEARKMILRQIIKKVYVGRHYEVKLELAISFAEYQRLYLEEKIA